MKYLLAILLIIPMFASAGFVSKSDVDAFKLDNSDGVDNYSRKASCESKESSPCLPEKKNYRRWMIGPVEDLNKPQYSKQDVETCDSIETCQPLLEAKDCSAYPDGSYPVMLEDFSEVYCAELTGYGTKDGWVVDQAGRDALAAEKIEKAAEKALRRQKRQDRRADMRTCKTALGDADALTDAEIKTCIGLLVNEVYELDIDAVDL